MTARGLSKEEIEKRLIRLRNLEHLHLQQRFRIWHLRDENRILKKNVVLLKTTLKEQQKTIDDLKLRMEELRTMVFGKKKKYTRTDDDNIIPPKEKTLRTSESYKRPIPDETQVTRIERHPLESCSCGAETSERETVVMYEEDIPLSQKKTVVKHLIEKGYCAVCGTWSASVPLPVAPVVLGGNIKRYVTYLSIVCRQSYAQIQDVLKQTYDFALSQGEIAKILEKEGTRLRPEYERLKERIRGEPSVHLDETGWSLFIGDGYRRYAWTMVGGESFESVFMLGKTRGKGNADDLLGDSKAVVVSDDYAAYRNLTHPHQLCCAHILRKLRDLAGSTEIKDEIRALCASAYQTFAEIYADIETARTSCVPSASYDTLLKRLQMFTAPHSFDPAKLTRIKTQIAARTQNYLTCLLYAGVASDNNAAERSLRHLVLKNLSTISYTLRNSKDMNASMTI